MLSTSLLYRGLSAAQHPQHPTTTANIIINCSFEINYTFTTIRQNYLVQRGEEGEGEGENLGWHPNSAKSSAEGGGEQILHGRKNSLQNYFNIYRSGMGKSKGIQVSYCTNSIEMHKLYHTEEILYVMHSNHKGMNDVYNIY